MKKFSDVAINRPTTRAKLPRRHDPYWRGLGTGSLGFRKSESGLDTWVARWRGEDRKYKFNKLGDAATMDYDAAAKAAEAWFESCRQGVVRAGTVEEVCKLYIANIGIEKGEQAKQFAEWTLKANVYKDGVALGRIPLDRLTPAKVTEWRDGLVTDTRKANSANRIIRTFKAAMNYGYRQGLVQTDRAWKVVQQFKAADGQREVFLNAKQRAALLAECSPELADLLTGLFFTAARPTELTVATLADLDLKTKTLKLTTHKGNGAARVRSVPLTAQATKFFKARSASKLPSAYLFTAPGGAPWTRHQYALELRTAVAAAKLPPGTVAYSMRHTAISEWLQAGVDIATVAKLAGTSVAMIDKNYHKYIRTSVEDKLATVKL